MKKFWKKAWKPAVAVAAALVLALGIVFGYPMLRDNFKTVPGGSSATSSRYGSASSSYAGSHTEDGTSSDGVFVVGSEETAESAAPESAAGGNGVSPEAGKAQTDGSKPSGQSSGKTG